jgi:hypothetical protein
VGEVAAVFGPEVFGPEVFGPEVFGFGGCGTAIRIVQLGQGVLCPQRCSGAAKDCPQPRHVTRLIAQ